MPHLMQQSCSEFLCCLVYRSLGNQRVRQINPSIVPDERVVRAKVKEVRAIAGSGEPLRQSHVRLIPVTVPNHTPARKSRRPRTISCQGEE